MDLRFRSITTVPILVRSAAVTIAAAAMLISCASNNLAPVLDASTIIGRWESRSGGFFQTSGNECGFFRGQKFSCTSYSLRDDLVLTYDGIWLVTGNQLQLKLEQDQPYIYYVVDMGRHSFTIDSRLSGKRTFYRVSEFE